MRERPIQDKNLITAEGKLIYSSLKKMRASLGAVKRLLPRGVSSPGMADNKNINPTTASRISLLLHIQNGMERGYSEEEMLRKFLGE